MPILSLLEFSANMYEVFMCGKLFGIFTLEVLPSGDQYFELKKE